MNEYQERPRKGGGKECTLDGGATWRRLLPIAFTAENSQKVHDGMKTQTRRLLKPQPNDSQGKLQFELGTYAFIRAESGLEHHGLERWWPRYRVGDVLWVQEPWRTHMSRDKVKPTELPDDAFILHEGTRQQIQCIGKGTTVGECVRIRPGRFLPLRFARSHRYEVVAVRCERVNGISEADALAEGCDPERLLAGKGATVAQRFAELCPHDTGGFRLAFGVLWNSIHLEPSPIYARRDDGRSVIIGYKSFPWSNADLDAAHPGVRARGIYRKKPITVTDNPWVFAYTFKQIL